MQRLLLILGLVLLAASADAATVIYDHPTSVTASGVTTTYTVAQVQAWTPTLYVNNVSFPMTHTCALAGAAITCTATLPLVATALTPSGAQTFQVTFRDPVLGEGARSSPLVLARPVAPTGPRIQ